MAVDRAQVLAVLRRVYDPDYVERSIVDMGLVGEEDIAIGPQGVRITYGLTAPMCPFSAAIGLLIQYAVETALGVAVEVRLRDDHRQAGVVAGLLADPRQRQELMAKLRDYGILERCVRL